MDRKENEGNEAKVRKELLAIPIERFIKSLESAQNVIPNFERRADTRFEAYRANQSKLSIAISSIWLNFRLTFNALDVMCEAILVLLYKFQMSESSLSKEEIVSLNSKIEALSRYVEKRKKAFDWADNLLKHTPETEDGSEDE